MDPNERLSIQQNRKGVTPRPRPASHERRGDNSPGAWGPWLFIGLVLFFCIILAPDYSGDVVHHPAPVETSVQGAN